MVELGDRTLALEPGGVLHLPADEPHAVRAQADSGAPLTLCLHGQPPSRQRGPAPSLALQP